MGRTPSSFCPPPTKNYKKTIVHPYVNKIFIYTNLKIIFFQIVLCWTKKVYQKKLNSATRIKFTNKRISLELYFTPTRYNFSQKKVLVSVTNSMSGP